MRCMCVCKSWHSLIRDRAFMKKHLSRRQTTLFISSSSVLSGSPRLCSKSTSDGDNKISSMSTNYYLPEEMNYSTLILEGYDRGILCLSECFSKFYLWNPATEEVRIIGSDPTHSVNRQRPPSYRIGFGVDPLSNKCKVVRALCSTSIYEEEEYVNLFKRFTSVTVYSFGRSGSCRKKDKKMPDIFSSLSGYDLKSIRTQSSGTCSVVVNGSVHWMLFYGEGYCDTFGIVSFHLGLEQFKLIMSPEHINADHVQNMGKLHEHLSFITWDREVDNLIEIWVMKEYGVSDSWTKESKINLADYDLEWSLVNPYYCTFIGIGNDGDVLFLHFGYSGVTWYDPRNSDGNKLKLIFGEEVIDGIVPNFAVSFFRIS